MTNEPEKMNENVNAASDASAEKPKKKKPIMIFRPQNSKTGMVKSGQRPGTVKKTPAKPAAKPAAKPVEKAAQPQPVKEAAAPVKPEVKAEAPVKAAPAPKAEASVKAEAPKVETVVKTEAPKAEAPKAEVKTESAVKEAPKAVAAEPAKAAPVETAKPAVSAAPKAPAAEPVKSSENNQERRNDTRPAREGQRRDGDRGQGSFQRRDGDRSQGGFGGQRRDGDRNQGGFGGQRRDGDRNQGSFGGQRRDGDRNQGGFGGQRRDGDRNQGGFGGQRRDGDRNQGGFGGQRRDGDRNQGGFGGQRRDNANGDNRGRSFQGGSGMGAGRGAAASRPAPEGKPFDKESRNKNGRKQNDVKKPERGDKFDRMEHSSKNGGKNKNAAKPKAVLAKPVKVEEKIKSITIPETLTIKDLADAMKIAAAQIIKKLFLAGKMVTVNEEISFEEAEEIAIEYDIICEKEVKVDVIEELLKEEEDPEETMTARPPVVCVMGHVDHGKTSLLDAIRNTHVTDRESGGITQHIGASVVTCNDQKITFLDTPGHEAFTAMRMRGASSTDIAILVVAADDGVMPQTVEAINHAKAAGIEIIVAINKIDKPGANPEKVKQELTEYELVAEDWGGSTIMVPVSAKTHEGIDNLLEMVLLTAEVLELKANANRRARGLVIEAQLDKGRGPVATVLVQKGVLHVGDPICAGPCFGRIRVMLDDKGRRVKEAGPSTPVEIVGFSDVPGAGEIMVSPETEKEAKTFAETFIRENKERLIEETKQKMSLDDLFSQIQAGNLKELKLIVKADVQGSVEAVKQSLMKLSNEEVVVKVIHSGAGAINESDVILASASNAIIIGFNIKLDPQATNTAEQEGVDVRIYSVIYDAINDVEKAMKGMLDPIYEEKILGHAEVRQTFRASGVGTIAGSFVQDGVLQRGCNARITRDGVETFNGPLSSLKRFKDDVKEVKAGYECGLVFEKFNDLREGDIIEAYMMVEVPR